jgi:hypothetical protein
MGLAWLAAFGAFGALSACRAIVGSYEIGDGKDAATGDAKIDSTAEIAVDSAPPLDSSEDVAVDTGDAGLLSSCRAILAASPSSVDGIYSIAAKEGPVRVWCDMTRDKKGYTLVAVRSASTSSSPWRSEVGVIKVRELIDPLKPDDAVLDIDWTQLAFDEVIYELGPPPATRALFSTLTTTQKSGARGALSVLPRPEDKPTCVIDSTPYPACSPPPLDGGVGPPPGDPGKGLGWLFSPTGVSCWWAWDISLGAQECKTGKAGGGRVWVR